MEHYLDADETGKIISLSSFLHWKRLWKILLQKIGQVDISDQKIYFQCVNWWYSVVLRSLWK